MEELKTIMQKFVASGWDLIAIPAQQWLDGKSDKESLISAIKQADEECGSSDIPHYYAVEKEAPMTFSPDASFPVINRKITRSG